MRDGAAAFLAGEAGVLGDGGGGGGGGGSAMLGGDRGFLGGKALYYIYMHACMYICVCVYLCI